MGVCRMYICALLRLAPFIFKQRTMTTDFFTLLLLLTPFIAWTSFQVLRLILAPLKSTELPPGPFSLPIVGNLLHLGKKPHQSLAKLSKIYGPIMHLKLGSMHTIVVSSPKIAKEILQKHDLAFSSRTVSNAAQFVDHHNSSLAFLPVGRKWRNFRKICKEHMFSKHKLDASQGLRLEELQKLHDYVQDSCISSRGLNICEVAFVTSLNLISCTMFSVDFTDFEGVFVHEIKGTIQGLMRVLGTPNLSDYIPLLKFIDPQGIMRETEIYGKKILDILDGIITQRVETRCASSFYAGKDDLLEELLDLNQESDAAEFSINDIKHLLLDLLIAGVDTTAGTVEWAMTELVRNPEIMSKAQNELCAVIGENEHVEESDIERLPYLHALIKETFRLHPAGPFLVPHKSIENTKINGYMIPKNAQTLVNVWAMRRDSTIWSNAELFEPKRFLDSQMDYKGQDFELIPFGSGRRMCPGMPLAHRMVHLIVAYLIHGFDLKLEPGTKPEEVDMSEKFGLSLHKAIPLQVFPIKK